ncbi:MAG: exopolysaccharide biosynthesis polyprenyl glycosylphosphotransferase [Candidatus Dormibacteria bacterium]
MISQEHSRPTPSERVRRGLAISERRLLLGAGDLAVVAVGFVVAFNLRTASVRHLGFAVPRVALAITMVIWLISAELVDAYRLSGTVNLRGTFRSVIGSMAIAFLGLLTAFFIVPYRVTRPTLVLWVPIATALLLAWRIGYRRIFAGEIFAGTLAVVADLASFQRVWPDATGVMRGLYRVVEVVDPARPDCGDILTDLVSQGRVNQVVLGVRDEVSRDLFKTLLSCYDLGVPVRSLSDLYEELTGRLLLDQLGHSWLLALPMRSETSRIYAAFKRSVDLVSGIAGLLVLGLILPFFALAVLLEDRGSIFYRQVRVGQYGKTFDIVKLRTMRDQPAYEQRQTDSADSRVTVGGRLVRRFHLDELPQAWNIIRGEMSLIGPRPEQPAYVEQLQEQIDFYNTRLSVRPGLTGWAQINFGYGAGVEGARQKLSYDLYYIKRQSPSLDLLIMFRTSIAVFSISSR